MNTLVDIDELMNQFRLASRELFNHFFRVPSPYSNGELAWSKEERFCEVQSLLFQKMVTEPASLSVTEYGFPQSDVLVEPRHNGSCPIMLNREVDSGYWDDPISEVSGEACLLFIGFFDWDQLDYRDNRYVRIQVASWPTHPDTVGKHALIESQYVRFLKALRETGSTSN